MKLIPCRSWLLAAVMCCGGCGAVGTIIHGVYGDPPIAAKFNPPAVPTLVLVEDYRSPGEVRIDGDRIARLITEELKSNTKVEFVDPDKLALLRQSDATKYQAMSVTAIGREMGAKQVIYVDLRELATATDLSGGAVHADSTAWVKVMKVDADPTTTLWPANATRGLEISAKIEYDPIDSTLAAGMHNKMLGTLSSRISKLFYTWKPDNQYEENAGG